MNIYDTLIFRPVCFALLMGLAGVGGAVAGFTMAAVLRLCGVVL